MGGLDNFKILKKTAGLSVAIFLVGMMVFVIFEPAILNASTNTNNITLTATVSQEVTISSPGDTSFSTSIPGVSGNPGDPVTASRTWKVITNDASGFDLKLHASQTNALYQDSNYYFSDYGTPPTPTYGWTSPSSGNAVFGFSISAATAADTATAFKDGGSSCGTGSNTGGCWAGFNNTSDITVIHRTTLTDGNGQNEIVNFKAESNAKLLEEGNYTATITATASLN